LWKGDRAALIIKKEGIRFSLTEKGLRPTVIQGEKSNSREKKGELLFAGRNEGEGPGGGETDTVTGKIRNERGD